MYDDSLLFLREAFVADPARFPHNLELLRSGALADREVLVVLVDREGRLIFTDAPNVKPGLSVADRAYYRFFPKEARTGSISTSRFSAGSPSAIRCPWRAPFTTSRVLSAASWRFR